MPALSCPCSAVPRSRGGLTASAGSAYAQLPPQQVGMCNELALKIIQNYLANKLKSHLVSAVGNCCGSSQVGSG